MKVAGNGEIVTGTTVDSERQTAGVSLHLLPLLRREERRIKAARRSGWLAGDESVARKKKCGGRVTDFSKSDVREGTGG